MKQEVMWELKSMRNIGQNVTTDQSELGESTEEEFKNLNFHTHFVTLLLAPFLCLLPSQITWRVHRAAILGLQSANGRSKNEFGSPKRTLFRELSFDEP